MDNFKKQMEIARKRREEKYMKFKKEQQQQEDKENFLINVGNYIELNKKKRSAFRIIRYVKRNFFFSPDNISNEQLNLIPGVFRIHIKENSYNLVLDLRIYGLNPSIPVYLPNNDYINLSLKNQQRIKTQWNRINFDSIYGQNKLDDIKYYKLETRQLEKDKLIEIF